MGLKDDKIFRLKTVQTHVVDVVNEEGVVVKTHTSAIKYIAGGKDEFFLMYSSFLIHLEKCRDLRVAMFAALIKRYADGREFMMGNAMFHIIAKEIGCSHRSLELVFPQLREQELVLTVRPRVYIINPKYVFKGGSKARDAKYKMVMDMTHE